MLRGKKHLLSQERACELQHTGLASLHFQAGFNDSVLHQRLQQGSVALPKLTEREQDAAESRTRQRAGPVSPTSSHQVCSGS